MQGDLQWLALPCPVPSCPAPIPLAPTLSTQPQVLAPEDCGRGFSEVGALSEAKNTLREAVQLPLKHPELFTGGALARSVEGMSFSWLGWLMRKNATGAGWLACGWAVCFPPHHAAWHAHFAI